MAYIKLMRLCNFGINKTESYTVYGCTKEFLSSVILIRSLCVVRNLVIDL